MATFTVPMSRSSRCSSMDKCRAVVRNTTHVVPNHACNWRFLMFGAFSPIRKVRAISQKLYSQSGTTASRRARARQGVAWQRWRERQGKRDGQP